MAVLVVMIDKVLVQNKRKDLIMSSVVFDGILKIKLSDEQISFIEQLELPSEAIRLKQKYLHVTLIHQAFLKEYRPLLKEKSKRGELLEAPSVRLENIVEVRTDELLGRKSWVVWVQNQLDLRSYVERFMEDLTGTRSFPEPDRVFHVSIANLTGNRGDSVK